MADLAERRGGSDRTAQAVAQQLRAMGCEGYEVGIREAVSERMLLRTWSAAEVQEAVAWLKRMNAHGNDIYIRPAGSVGLILVDDLTADAVERLREDGLAPAAVVETSPHNFQVWMRVSQEPIAPELATAVGRLLAQQYGGDPGSIDWRHFGRLAGYTNRKPKHQQESGLQPYVLLRGSSGRAADATAAAQLLRDAQASLEPPEPPIATSPAAPPQWQAGRGRARTPAEEYERYAAPIRARYPEPDDYSRLDWMVCRDIASRNLDADQHYLEQVLLAGSPDLAERRRGHVEDYVARTAEKVLRDPEVVAARRALARQVTIDISR